ncbi:MAG: c-type cytochrome [Chloroflexota bacterium]
MKSRLFALLTLTGLALSACTFTLAEDVTPPPGYQSPTPPPTVGPLFPAAAPDLTTGQAIYVEKCLPCHGEKGFGDGPQNEQLPVSVAPIGMADTVRAVAPADWYMVVTRGNIERFMPPFASLNEQQRWDVIGYVYSLSIEPADIETGAALYAGNCAECHGPNGEGGEAGPLTDQTYMAKVSNQDLYLAITTGVGDKMEGFSDKIAEADRWALAAFVRSLSFSRGQVAEAAPSPTSTPEPATATATLEPAPTAATQSTPGETETPASETPASAGTPVTETVVAAESPTPESQPTGGPAAEATPTNGEQAATSGTVAGSVTNGSGGAIPEGLTVTLHGYDPDMTSGNFSETVTREISVNPDGSFTFENIELLLNRAFVASVNAYEVDYSSEPVFVDETLLQSGSASVEIEMPVTIYETSTDASALSVDRLHLFLDFSLQDTVQVVEVYIISNPTTKAVVPAAPGQPSVLFDLPEGATNLQFEIGGIGDPYVLTDSGFGDLTPVLPSAGEHQVVVNFSLPYDDSLDFAQTMSLPTNAVVVLSPEGTLITGDLLSPGESRDFQGTAYTLYNAGAIAAGGEFRMAVSGMPTAASASSPAVNTTSRSLLIGAGGLGVVLILLGVYLFWRDRRANPEAEFDESEAAIETAQDALDAVIALDDQFRAGAISEENYKHRRDELKARLKELL